MIAHLTADPALRSARERLWTRMRTVNRFDVSYLVGVEVDLSLAELLQSSPHPEVRRCSGLLVANAHSKLNTMPPVRMPR